MKKNIILCSDGTGNSGGKGRGTNVWRIFNAIDLNGHKWQPDKAPQVAFHDDGVGTQSNVVLKALGGALGLGLIRNIREIYTFLVKNYDPGDRICLFGFSRGAYTIRALGGLIAQVGIIDRRKYDDDELRPLVKEAVAILRRNFQTKLMSQLSSEDRKTKRKESCRLDAAGFRKRHCIHDEEQAPDGVVDIAFVGVWDTVDAYGFPFDFLADFWHYAIYPFRFPDTKMSERIHRGSHAISIDDERQTFHPVLWDEDESTSQRVNQVWFPGVHSNVGGGYPKDGLAQVTLDWMMSEAEAGGLRFLANDRAHVRDMANAYDKLYNSRSGAGVYYRYKPRDIGEICKKHNIDSPKIHVSTFRRIRSSVEGYAPGNLPKTFSVVGTAHRYPAVDEGEDQLEELRSSITSKLEEPLLDEVRGFVNLRRFLHHTFVAITLAVLVAAWILRDEDGGLSASASAVGSLFGSIPDWLFSFVVRPFYAQPFLTVPIVFGSLALIWALGARIRDKMHRRFAARWRKVFVGN